MAGQTGEQTQILQQISQHLATLNDRFAGVEERLGAVEARQAVGTAATAGQQNPTAAVGGATPAQLAAAAAAAAAALAGQPGHAADEPDEVSLPAAPNNYVPRPANAPSYPAIFDLSGDPNYRTFTGAAVYEGLTLGCILSHIHDLEAWLAAAVATGGGLTVTEVAHLSKWTKSLFEVCAGRWSELVLRARFPERTELHQAAKAAHAGVLNGVRLPSTAVQKAVDDVAQKAVEITIKRAAGEKEATKSKSAGSGRGQPYRSYGNYPRPPPPPPGAAPSRV